MYLEHQGVFSNQVVVPLTAHLDLYRALKQSADRLGNEVSFKRTDLALFDLARRAGAHHHLPPDRSEVLRPDPRCRGL